MTTLPMKEHGKPLLIIKYFKMVREDDGFVTATKGMIIKHDWLIVSDFGDPMHITRYWVYSLLKKMNIAPRQ